MFSVELIDEEEIMVQLSIRALSKAVFNHVLQKPFV